MKKKNLNVHKQLKKILDDYEINKIYLNFKKRLKFTSRKPFLVAVSGGPDSLALTALSKLYTNESRLKAYFVLIDHSIRKNSSKEAYQVKKILQKQKIILKILKNKTKITKNIQSQAREARYALLLKFCNKNNIKYILTAHHSDDQIETFLIRLSRGSGIQGLSSMDDITILDKKTKLLRPLLKEKKKNLLKITRKVFGKSIKDPSNKDKKYLRTRVRLLKKELEKSGVFHDQIIKSINNLTSTRNTLNMYIKKITNSYVKKKKRSQEINLKKILLETKEIQIKIISTSIKEISKSYYPPRSKKVLNLLNRLKFDKKFTLGGCILIKTGDILSVKREI